MTANFRKPDEEVRNKLTFSYSITPKFSPGDTVYFLTASRKIMRTKIAGVEIKSLGKCSQSNEEIVWEHKITYTIGHPARSLRMNEEDLFPNVSAIPIINY